MSPSEGTFVKWQSYCLFSMLPPSPAHPFFHLPLHLAESRTLTWGSGMSCQGIASKTTKHTKTSWHTSPFLDSDSCLKDHTQHLRASAPWDLGAAVQGHRTPLTSQPAGHSWAPALCASSPGLQLLHSVALILQARPLLQTDQHSSAQYQEVTLEKLKEENS